MPIDRAKAEQMSLEQLVELRDQLKSQQPQQPQGLLPRQNPMQGLGRLIAGAGQAYTTGKVPMDMFEQGGTAEPDWYTKQQLEYQQKLELEKEKQRLSEASQRAALESLPEGEWTTDTVRIGDRTLKRQPSPEERQAEIMQLAEKESVKGEAMAERERLKKKKQSDVDFEIARNKLRTTAAAFKAMAGASGGMGRVKGFLGGEIGGRLGINPYAQAYKGQLVEAAAALAKLASPSARVGKDIIEQFKETLPSVTSTEGEFLSQIRFSLHNAFATALANREEPYTPEQRAEVDRMVDELINVPPMSVEDMRQVQSGKTINASKYSSSNTASGQDDDYANYLKSIGQ